MINKTLEIKPITSSKTLPIRHKVMWPNKPMDYVKLPNDENARHYGLFINGEIASIISLFTEGDSVQFRKFATLIKYQGLGYGTILLKHIINVIDQEGVKKLWCNARVEKSKFYERFNLKTTDQSFTKDGIEYVIMENTFVKNMVN